MEKSEFISIITDILEQDFPAYNKNLCEMTASRIWAVLDYRDALKFREETKQSKEV